MQALADDLAVDVRFRNAVTLADVDGVPIATVLTETDLLIAAARLARLQVSNDRARAAEAGQT